MRGAQAKLQHLLMQGDGNDCTYIYTAAHLKHTILPKGKSKYLFTAPWRAATQLMRSINILSMLATHHEHKIMIQEGVMIGAIKK